MWFLQAQTDLLFQSEVSAVSGPVWGRRHPSVVHCMTRALSHLYCLSKPGSRPFFAAGPFIHPGGPGCSHTTAHALLCVWVQSRVLRLSQQGQVCWWEEHVYTENILRFKWNLISTSHRVCFCLQSLLVDRFTTVKWNQILPLVFGDLYWDVILQSLDFWSGSWRRIFIIQKNKTKVHFTHCLWGFFKYLFAQVLQ